MGYLFINSIRNKFSSIPNLIDNDLNVFTIAETKLYSSLSESQFILPVMGKHFQLDVNRWKVGIFFWVSFRDKSKTTQATGGFYILSSRPKIDYFLLPMTGLLDHYLKSYKDFRFLMQIKVINMKVINLF